MSDIQQLFERQARWQKTRKALSWPQKIQMAEKIRESARELRAVRKAELHGPSRGGSKNSQAQSGGARP